MMIIQGIIELGYNIHSTWFLDIRISTCFTTTVQLNLNFTHVCGYTRVLAHLICAKLQKLVCACTVACSFGMRTWDSKHMRDAHHKLALGLPHYTCGATTGTVAVGNEMQLLCSKLASIYVTGFEKSHLPRTIINL